MRDCVLGVGPRRVVLQVPKQYLLDLPIQWPLCAGECGAQFDTSTQVLSVLLAVE